MLEALEEESLKEQPLPYESQLTALNASQQDFLVSLGREKTSPVPFNAALVEGLLAAATLNPHHPTKHTKEATPPQMLGASEDVTLQQAAASLPAVVKAAPHGDSSHTTEPSSSELDPSTLDIEKTNSTTNLDTDVTPQQEAQPPAIQPFPIPPHLMMQRPYMMPMPMFYGPTPGFYPPSFPGMPGMPGMSGMMMPPYGPHVIPPPMMHQQQTGGQQVQGNEPLQENSPATSSAKLTPPTHPPVELESSSSTTLGNQYTPVTDTVEVPARQAGDAIPEDSQSPVHSAPATADGVVVPPTASVLSSTLEEEHNQEDDDGQLPAFVDPPAATSTTQHNLVTEQVDAHQNVPKTSPPPPPPPNAETDVNISNPG